MVPADPSVKEVLPRLPFPIPAIDIDCIIELLQDPVIPALLFNENMRCPVLRVELPNAVGIVDMGLLQLEFPAYPLCLYTIGDMYVPVHLFHLMEHLPPDHGHIRRRCHGLELWLFPI